MNISSALVGGPGVKGEEKRAAAELFGPNRRQPTGKGSMQIRVRLGVGREDGEGGSWTAMKGGPTPSE